MCFSGLKINKQIQLQFCNRIQKFSRNFTNYSGKIIALHYVVNSLAKQNMSPQNLFEYKNTENER